MDSHFRKLSFSGLIITLGIIYGDIGTSPLYTFSTILGGKNISQELVYGAISCVFWTLTLQTTFKYIILTLQADNHGEGGIFSLYALVRRFGKWLVIPAIIGAGTLIADGIITPPITVTSAIEGLRDVRGLGNVMIPGGDLVVGVVIGILTLLFMFQRFGTKVVGGSFGPIMLVWFTMLGSLGGVQILHHPGVLAALSPVWGIRLLTQYPGGFWLLGAVFLCTTGAEALYSDLGHCGIRNIRVSWIFVKTTLVLNYLGQGAWVMNQHVASLGGANPFFRIMPQQFLLSGIIIATLASIIASQALISGSFTLINEAVLLHLWPRIKTKYPTDIRGQIYIPSINWFLWTGCMAVVLYFKTSDSMTAAYGFSITVAMMMTTVLMYYFMRYRKHWPLWIVVLILCVFLSVEFSFFVTNAVKITKRWMFLVCEFGLIFTMYIWYYARKITNRFLNFVDIHDYLPKIADLSADTSVAKYASQVIFMTKANTDWQVEQKILYSIFNRSPKRADIYWLLHIDRTDDPYTMEYTVLQLLPGKLIKVNFRLGFRVQARINLLFRKVVEEMVSHGEVDITSKYESLSKYHLTADFRFVLIEKFLSVENEFSLKEGFILNSYFFLRKLGQSDSKAFGLDTSEMQIEKIPLVVNPVGQIQLIRRPH
ncbi:MAG TPA: KUP/HAK/KT family potassium transporter [Chitinophagaceae bacterium]|nr:KUP/HAK/KT family potassium transporter [Chitinophagaceae bacterium]